MLQKFTKPIPKDRSHYCIFFHFPTRWRDNDQYGHVNNAVYYELFDSAVNKFLIESGIPDMTGGTELFLVVSSGCNYFEEVTYPHDLEVGLSVSRLGGSSVTYDLGLFVAGKNLSSANGFLVHVNVGADDHRPKIINKSIN